MSSLDGHVVVVTAEGSFTPSGRRLTGPVSDAEKLHTLIGWAAGRGLLQPLSTADDRESVPGRVWVVGPAWMALAGIAAADGTPDPDSAAVPALLSATLGMLAAKGWEVRGSRGGSFAISRTDGGIRLSVELLVEPAPWLAAGDLSVGEDAAELGRRAAAWSTELGVLPAATAALSGAALLDAIMAARSGRRGAVLEHPGTLPDGVNADPRVLPEWVSSPDQAETAFTHAEELVLLRQEMGLLASAGMVTLGHGQPRTLTGPDAAAAAAPAKRPFGLWRAVLPPLDGLGFPDLIPAPHPRMGDAPVPEVWLTTEDISALGRAPRDGGAGLAVEDLHIDAAVLWPHQSRLLEAWASRLREAREHLGADPILRHLIDTAAEAYLTALADPTAWDEGANSPHFQPAWLAAIAAHTRARALRVAQRTGREYRVWPLWAHNTAMIYAVDLDQTTGRAVDLSDTHTRLGRMITAARVDAGSDIILAVLLAESPQAMAHALTAPFGDIAPQGNSVTPAGAQSVPGTPITPERVSPPQPPSAPAGQPGVDDDAPISPAATGTPGRGRRAKTTAAVAISSAPAAVLHSDGLWLPDGTRLDITEPIVHAGQIAELALRLATTHNLGYRLTPQYAEPPQIWITDDVCMQVGIDVESIDRYKTAESVRTITEGIDFVTLAAAAGWKFGGVADTATPRLGIWTRLFREGDPRGALIALIPAMALKSDKELPILLVGEATPLALARRLQLFADTMKWPFNQSSNTTALDLMLHTRPRTYSWQDWKDRVFAPSTTEPPYGLTDVEEDFNWTRTPSEHEQQHRFVHAYDRGASYPSAIAGLELPIGDPVHHTEPVPFNPKTPGYWLIEVPEPDEWRMPYVLNPRGLKFHEPKWVTTPRLERAIALGYEPTILQAVIWPEHGRILNNWYQRFRDAASALDPADPEQNAVLKQIKVVRSSGIGLIGSETYLKGRTGYSPERRFHIVAKASSNIVHALAGIGEKTGRWPVAVLTDPVLYLSDDPDPATAWPGDPKKYGTGFGQFKPEGSALLSDHLRYLDGGAYRGKDQLIDPADWTGALTAPADTGGS
jgi:DNA-directed RNA polymerase specialized sigma24 family protein